MCVCVRGDMCTRAVLCYLCPVIVDEVSKDVTQAALIYH